MPQSFLDRLKERRLFRWAAAYLAGAWVLFEVSDVVGGRLGWPDTLYQTLLVFLGTGLLITLVLAWYHGEQGRQRVDAVEVTVIGALVVVGVSTAWLLAGVSRRTADPIAAVEVNSPQLGTVAVLAFSDMSEKGDQAYFAEGMAEEIAGLLSRIPGIRVAARTSSFMFRDTDTDVRVIGAQLGVRHVLEGSVRRDGDLVRIAAKLIDAEDGFEVWSAALTRHLTNVVELQEDIARVVASELAPQLGELPAEAPRTTTPEAHLAYLRGRYHWHRQNNQAAVASFEEAIAIDSAFAAAWAGLGSTLTVLVGQGLRSPAEAIAAVERAFALDPESPEVLAAKARIDLTFFYDWAAAEDALARSVSRDPSHIETRHWYSHVLSWTQRHALAVAQAEAALALDPLSPFMNLNLGNALRFAGRHTEAVAQLEHTVGLEPGFALAYLWLWDAHLANGDTTSAAEALSGWVRVEGGSQEARRLVSDAIAAHRRTGRPVAVAPEVIGELRLAPELTRRMYGQLGQYSQVMEGLLAAADARAGAYDLLSIKYSDNYPSLRSDPRFQELVRRIGPS